jgi:hypothetical protein
MTAGSGAIYHTGSRLTFANYNASGTLHFEVNGGNGALTLNSDTSASFVSTISATQGIFYNPAATSNTTYIGHSNTGAYLGTAVTGKPLYFETSGSEKVRISNSGNVGIGTTAPEVRLHIQAPNNLAAIRLQNTAANKVWELNPSNPDVSNTGLTIWNVTDNTKPFHITDAGNVGIGTTAPERQLHVLNSAKIEAGIYFNNTLAGSGAFLWQEANESMRFGTNNTERMRITSAGDFLVGKTANGWTVNGLQTETNGTVLGVTNSAANDNNLFLRKNNIAGNVAAFYYNSTTVGTISITSTTTSYNTSSDYRLKEDLKSIKGLEIVNKIKVYDYKWKASDSRMDGVLAHELAEVLPYAVSGVKDGEQMQGVDYSKIVPVMVQAIKDLKQELDLLKNK